MKFLIDAHLPHALGALLKARGHDVLHTGDLPTRNATSDEQVNAVSASEQRILISKDNDFYFSHLLRGRPHKLVLLRVGNLKRRELVELLGRHLPELEAALHDFSLIELDRHRVVRVS